MNRLSNSLRFLCDLCVSAVSLLVVSVRPLFNSRRTQAFALLSASIITSLSGSAPRRLAPPIASESEIDAALQQAATAALGQREGAIIVMDPQTGRVRAVVNPKIAFAEAVMPGSTMKPFTALAALRSGLIDPNSRTVCPGRFNGLSFSVACVHDNRLPPFNPSQAIAYSCNYYFGTLGERLGRDKLIEELRGFGFGQPNGLSDERGKLLPCEAGNNAKVRSPEKAQADCNAREAIGESDHFTVTPVQLLTAYAALVNGGRLLARRARADRHCSATPCDYHGRDAGRRSLRHGEERSFGLLAAFHHRQDGNFPARERLSHEWVVRRLREPGSCFSDRIRTRAG